MNPKPEFKKRLCGPSEKRPAVRAGGLLPCSVALILTFTNFVGWDTSSYAFSDADWVSLGSGMVGYYNDTHVYALAVIGTNLYAGGYFTNAGGVPANGIAKWDGNAWSALGSGVNSRVYALAVIGTNLYAGGGFTTAGGVPANGIAKWDGNTWSALGSGVNFIYNGVQALAVSGTNLYAGGIFTFADGAMVRGIAKWDGSAWSALGPELNGLVLALAVNGTNLYAGGGFTTAGGMQVNEIAKWNGIGWSPLGSGMHSPGIGGYPVDALLVSGTNLYAGGEFIEAGGVQVNGIAKWDGYAWSALGSGIGPNGCSVRALAVVGTNLYAGGNFIVAGGGPANCIAKWDGSAWSALGSGVNASVDALAADGVGHLFVGGDFTLAGTNVSPHIAQANVGSVPTILMPPQTQTAEIGSPVDFTPVVSGDPAVTCQLFFNGTNLLSCGADGCLTLSNTDFSMSGTYTVVVTNIFGAATSAPVTLNVIEAVERRPVPAINLMALPGSTLGLDYCDALGSTADWETMATMTLSNTSQLYFDLSPLPSQRFYRTWQMGTPSVVPSLNLNMVPAITLTGNIGDQLRLDCINQFGPTNAWVTLDTVTLTNTSQLYFDVSAIGQPARLWRIVPVP